MRGHRSIYLILVISFPNSPHLKCGLIQTELHSTKLSNEQYLHQLQQVLVDLLMVCRFGETAPRRSFVGHADHFIPSACQQGIHSTHSSLLPEYGRTPKDYRHAGYVRELRRGYHILKIFFD